MSEVLLEAARRRVALLEVDLESAKREADLLREENAQHREYTRGSSISVTALQKVCDLQAQRLDLFEVRMERLEKKIADLAGRVGTSP